MWFCGMCMESITLGSHPGYLILLSGVKDFNHLFRKVRVL